MHAFADLLVTGDGRWARRFENLILVLIVFSVASIGLETIPGLPGWAWKAFYCGEVFVIAVFTVEYALRIIAAPDRMRFIFSFQGMVDLLSVAPFYMVGFDALWLQSLRLLRLLRILKFQTHILERTVTQRTQELAAKNAALEKAQAQLRAELEIARALQIAILPATFPPRPGCDGAARMMPATFMGGDFYDFIELPGGRVGLVMADVSGKGVPAAFFMAVACTNLRDFAGHHSGPGACLEETNNELCAHNPMDLFVTVFYCILDPATGVLTYANGGHNSPYLKRADGSIQALDDAGGVVLGVKAGARFPGREVRLHAGDRLVLYTDGITEATNAAQELYGTDRLMEVLRAHGEADSGGLIQHICDSVMKFAGTAPQADDITLAVLTWNQKA